MTRITLEKKGLIGRNIKIPRPMMSGIDWGTIPFSRLEGDPTQGIVLTDPLEKNQVERWGGIEGLSNGIELTELGTYHITASIPWVPVNDRHEAYHSARIICVREDDQFESWQGITVYGTTPSIVSCAIVVASIPKKINVQTYVGNRAGYCLLKDGGLHPVSIPEIPRRILSPEKTQNGEPLHVLAECMISFTPAGKVFETKNKTTKRKVKKTK
jgi:hypothetical protein